jgi:3-oxoacyl-[acyl-carrier-protein] synthase II
MLRRVVVTGIGPVTSIGAGRAVWWAGLLEGRTGVSTVRSFDTTAYGVSAGAEVVGFRPEEYVRSLSWKCLGRASQLAIAAARLALADAGLQDVDSERAGVCVGTTSGEPGFIEEFDDAVVSGTLDELGPRHMLRYPGHMIGVNIADEFGLDGINVTIPCACAAGNYAIAHACEALRRHSADIMLAGGSDAFSRITYTGFARLGAIAPDVCRPFDLRRKGMIPGEGACMLVLEPLERALARGAHIYAEIAGYGFSCDAHHMTAAHPEGAGAARAMEKAMLASGVAPADVSYISAHGTGTPSNDRLETLAIKRVFGEQAAHTPVSSIKSMLGHTMGAASALEAACCALAIDEGRVPPTINFEQPDPECDLDCVPNTARELRVDVALNNAYAFGGNNSCVVLRRCTA